MSTKKIVEVKLFDVGTEVTLLLGSDQLPVVIVNIAEEPGELWGFRKTNGKLLFLNPASSEFVGFEV